jgi:hypothetical protein
MSRHYRRGEPAPRRESIRLYDAARTESGFEFQGMSEDGEMHRFVMSDDTLSELTGGNVAQREPGPAFERHRVRIYSVAARIFAAGVRATPIVIKAEFFGPSAR